VCRAASELGLKTVGIYAAEDAYAMHRFRPDESYVIGEGLGPLRP
jgi:pyruvate carboxylase